MRISFIGPNDCVTGSCYWLKDEHLGVEFLVDCGARQGELDAEEWNSRPLPFNPARLAFIVLTHGHLDHCGLLLRLVREGFRGTVYCTRETEEIARVVLEDAVRLGTVEGSAKDLARLRFHEPRNGGLFNSIHPIGTDLFLCFYRSAHILGAVSVRIMWGPKPVPGEEPHQRAITFSGDVGPNTEGGPNPHPLLRHVMYPIGGDYAVLESTYGDRTRDGTDQTAEACLEQLRCAIERTVFEKRGQLVIPSFAVDRAQALLFYLHVLYARHPERLREIPLLVDAAMAMRLSATYHQALRRVGKTPRGPRLEWLGRTAFELLGLDPKSVEDERVLLSLLDDVFGPSNGAPSASRSAVGTHRSEAVRSWRRVHREVSAATRNVSPPVPGIVLTGGGMCQGGPVVDYLRALLPLPSTTVLLMGYQSGDTVGGRLLALRDLSPEERSRLREPLVWRLRDKGPVTLPMEDVHADIEILRGLSAHADQGGLLRWALHEHAGRPILIAPTIFLTHGKRSARVELRRALHARVLEAQRSNPKEVADLNVWMPQDDQGWFDLDRGEWTPDELRSTESVLRAENETLRFEREQLRVALRNLRGQEPSPSIP